MDQMKSRTAYILQIHKNPNQVNQFIKQIIAENHADVFIHIDKKNYDDIKSKIIRSPRVNILKETIDVSWGDISLVDSTILLFKEVIASGVNYDFVCSRSGQDLLVKNGFTDFLAENKGKIFMNAFRVRVNEPHAAFVNVSWPRRTRKLYLNPFHPNRILRRGLALLYSFGWNILPNRNPLPIEFSIYNGSNWFCIPLEVVKYIIQFLADNKWYYEAYKNSLVPDEFFFQTLLMNSKFKTDVVNENLMYIKFAETLKGRNNPITLTLEHIDVIKRSNEYFARKFDENVDKVVIDYFANQVKM
jgi:hypothetical protein